MISLLLLAAAAAVSNNNGTIEGYEYPSMVLTDQDGHRTRIVPSSELPAPHGLPIARFNSIGQPGIDLNGQKIYFRLSDVKTKGMPDPDCQQLATRTRAPGLANTSTPIGATSGISTDSDHHCVRQK